jgi:hypothetical protein
MVGAIIAPIFILLFLFVWFSAMFPSCSVIEVETDTTPEYNTNAMNDFADAQYAAAFGLTEDYIKSDVGKAFLKGGDRQ